MSTVWSDDIECPKCKRFGGQHADYDYATCFTLTCEACGAVSDVEVVAVPAFGATPRAEDGHEPTP